MKEIHLTGLPCPSRNGGHFPVPAEVIDIALADTLNYHLN